MNGRQPARLPPQPVPDWGMLGSSPSSIASVLDSGEFVFTRSARSALTLALQLAGIGPGDQVLLPNYYCPTMPAPVERSGATPLFYPITNDALPDLDWLRAHVSGNCKAMVVAHFFGLPRGLGTLRDFCDGNRMLLIEDCAHAFFGAADGRSVGSWGHYSIASLPKFFPVIEGGVLVSTERKLAGVRLPAVGSAAQLRAVWSLLDLATAHGRLAGLHLPFALAAKTLAILRRRPAAAADGERAARVEAEEDVRAEALADPLLVPMRARIAEDWIVRRAERHRIVTRRRANYERLAQLLQGTAGVRPLVARLPEGAVPYVFPVWLDEPDDVYRYLRHRRLPVLRWDRYWPRAIRSPGDVGRSWGHHVIQILCHQDLARADLATIADALLAAASARERPQGVRTP